MTMTPMTWTHQTPSTKHYPANPTVIDLIVGDNPTPCHASQVLFPIPSGEDVTDSSDDEVLLHRSKHIKLEDLAVLKRMDDNNNKVPLVLPKVLHMAFKTNDNKVPPIPSNPPVVAFKTEDKVPPIVSYLSQIKITSHRLG
jgi:hypothetical protein